MGKIQIKQGDSLLCVKNTFMNSNKWNLSVGKAYKALTNEIKNSIKVRNDSGDEVYYEVTLFIKKDE